MNYIGDFPEDYTTVTIFFTTHDSSGAPVAPSSAFEAEDVKIYKNGSATEKTTTNGLTMTSPFDSITGLHCLVIDTSNDTGDGGFWVTGATYSAVLSPDETVDSQSVVKVIGSFGIELAPVLRPTVAGRELDVTAGGEAGLDWANIGSPTTTVSLSGTTIKTATDVETDTADIQSRLPAALVSGRIDASVGAMDSGVLTATAIAADAITAAKIADGAIDAATFAAGAIDAAAIAADAIDASALATDAVAEIQSGLSTLDAAGIRMAVGLASANLDTQIAALPTATEVATEVWGTNLSTDGTASDIILVNLDAPVSSRLATGDYTAPDNSSIAAIKAKTDSLTFTVAGQVDSNIESVNAVTVTGDGQTGTEWGPA